MSEPLTPEQEQDIRERAVYVRDLGVDADEYEIEVLAGTDVPALLAELDRTRAEMERRTRMLQASRDEAARLRAELEARPSRAAVCREMADRIWQRAQRLGGTWLRADQVRDALLTVADAAEEGEGRCCHLHRAVGCCDPEDCGPCCEHCPTCPTRAARREADRA